MSSEPCISVRRRLALVALALFAAGCTDETGPLLTAAQQPLAGRVASSSLAVLQQAATAPPLETYQRSFWAYVGTASTVTVNYQPAPGQSAGDPFLRLDIPRNALVAGAGGVPVKRGDSVSVTLTIDSLNFSVDFQPAGVLFSTKFPATLIVWYEHANPDLNGDGVVNGKDEQLKRQIAFWYKGKTWFQLPSHNDATAESVSTPLYHFSEYAIAW